MIEGENLARRWSPKVSARVGRHVLKHSRALCAAVTKGTRAIQAEQLALSGALQYLSCFYLQCWRVIYGKVIRHSKQNCLFLLTE